MIHDHFGKVNGKQIRTASASSCLPEITNAMIRERNNHTRLKINPAKAQAIRKVTIFISTW